MSKTGKMIRLEDSEGEGLYFYPEDVRAIYTSYAKTKDGHPVSNLCLSSSSAVAGISIFDSGGTYVRGVRGTPDEVRGMIFGSTERET